MTLRSVQASRVVDSKMTAVQCSAVQCSACTLAVRVGSAAQRGRLQAPEAIDWLSQGAFERAGVSLRALTRWAGVLRARLQAKWTAWVA